MLSVADTQSHKTIFDFNIPQELRGFGVLFHLGI